MAKLSSIEKNKNRMAKTRKYAERRAHLKAQIMNRKLDLGDRFQAVLKMARMRHTRRNSASSRIRNRCALNEINEVLKQMGLHLGTAVPNWPPENIEQLLKNVDESF